MNNKVTYIASLVITYLVGLGVGYTLLPSAKSALISPAGVVEEIVEEIPTAGKALVVIDPSEPKNQVCPLTGASYTTTEKNLWEKRRPMTIMIENHEEARPQSGINSADIVYEAVAEGAITRFMGVYYCDMAALDVVVGPVRSARTYFLDWASEYGKFPIYVHVGGANTPNKANALGQIKDYGWQGANDLNQFGLSVKDCWRDYTRIGHTVATEHTMYCSTNNLYKVAENRGFTNLDPKDDSWTEFFIPWKFGNLPEGGKPATTVDFDFWKDYAQYHVQWNYNPSSKTYLRVNGSGPHNDNNTKKQIETTTVIVQYVTETGPIDAEKHMLYGTIGSGNALIFSQGQAFTATWSKKSRLDRTVYKDSRGREFIFAPGKIWVEILAKNATVDYK